jgi:hypothetical protein
MISDVMMIMMMLFCFALPYVNFGLDCVCFVSLIVIVDLILSFVLIL